MKLHRYPAAFYVFTIFTFFLQTSHAQNSNSLLDEKARILADKKVSEVSFSLERATPSLIFFDKQSRVAPAETPLLLKNYLQLRAGYDDMIAVRQTALTNYSIPEYQQYFKGVKVEYSKYKALAKDKQVMMLAGSFYKIPESLSVTAGITGEHALQLAKQHVGAKHYVYEDLLAAIQSETRPLVRQALQSELKDVYPAAELVIVKDFTNKSEVDMRLAYKFNLYASEPLSRGYIFVDAQTGKILLYNSIMKHASVPTTVTTRYAGNRTIYVKQVSGNDPNSGLLLTSSHPTTESYVPGAASYVLIDDTKGKGIETYDLNAIGGLPISVPGVYLQAKSFTDVDNNWTLAEHKRGPGEEGANELENDDIAWDAHWGASVVYDYWKAKHGRLSYDNNDAVIKSYIHYGPAYDNAFWNGSVMTYGDGSGELAGGFKPLTSLDVCGHEIGHGVCSYTSDLVYESESGAMNEALSDIWASCIENFAMKSIDPSLASTYKPFFIGEQISSTPLRRMDNPKLASNPDTYGGQYWSNPDCTPTLANDQCGVHNNSGVLNKYFYLLTVGSGNGSGPDAGFAIAGVDDGLKDNGASYNSIPYSVTGVGFDVAEQLTYLTEILLSSTATYAEFRDVAIGVAKAYSGDPCSSVVQSVTNAMFAVGVGSAFTSPCVTTFGFLFQPGMTVNENNGAEGCDAQFAVNLPVLLPANSTASFTFGGTATQNFDYTISASSLTNSSASNKVGTLKVFIKNDAVIEGNETVVVNATINGATNANLSFTITIADDDVTPRIGKDAIVLLSENFDSYTDGFNQPSTWTQVLEIPEVPGIDPTANGRNQWGVFNGKLAIAPKLPVTGLPGTGGIYNNASTSQTRTSAPKIDARGLTNVQVKFDYTVQGEVDPNGVDPEQFGKFDYMTLVYSFDGTNFSEFGPGYYFASLVPLSGTFNDTLPAFLNNQQFYIGFRWVNDANAGGPVSVTIDNLEVKADPRKIETELSDLSAEVTGPNQSVYFYSKQDGEIIAKVDNQSSSNYGCMTATLQKAGSSTFELYTDGYGTHKVSEKVIRITPTTNNPIGAFDISLYMTEQEIAAIESVTGKSRTSFSVYKTNSPTIAAASAANTVAAGAFYTNIPGAGGIFTAPFSTGFSAFAVGAAVPGPLPVTCLDLKGTANGNNVLLNWKVTSEQNNRSFDVERSIDGVSFTKVAAVPADSRNNGLYSFTDNAAGLSSVFYRVRQVDASGTYRYICNTVLVKMSRRDIVIGNVYPNPVKVNAFVKIDATHSQRIRVEFVNQVGQVLNAYFTSIQQGTNTVSLTPKVMATGNYMVRFTDGNGQLLSTRTFVIK